MRTVKVAISTGKAGEWEYHEVPVKRIVLYADFPSVEFAMHHPIPTDTGRGKWVLTAPANGLALADGETQHETIEKGHKVLDAMVLRIGMESVLKRINQPRDAR